MKRIRNSMVPIEEKSLSSRCDVTPKVTKITKEIPP